MREHTKLKKPDEFLYNRTSKLIKELRLITLIKSPSPTNGNNQHRWRSTPQLLELYTLYKGANNSTLNI